MRVLRRAFILYYKTHTTMHTDDEPEGSSLMSTNAPMETRCAFRREEGKALSRETWIHAALDVGGGRDRAPHDHSGRAREEHNPDLGAQDRRRIGRKRGRPRSGA